MTAFKSKDLDEKLVGGIPTPLNNMSSSVGMMKFPIYGKIKFMFQTTNQETSGYSMIYVGCGSTL